jgi:hypothetical protein
MNVFTGKLCPLDELEVHFGPPGKLNGLITGVVAEVVHHCLRGLSQLGAGQRRETYREDRMMPLCFACLVPEGRSPPFAT